MSQERGQKSSTGATEQAVVERFLLPLDGADHPVPIRVDETPLQATLTAEIDAPHSCTKEGCGTCMSWL